MRRDVILLAITILLAAFVVAGSNRYRPAASCPVGSVIVCVVDGWTGKVILRTPEGGLAEVQRVVREWAEESGPAATLIGRAFADEFPEFRSSPQTDSLLSLYDSLKQE